MQMKSKTAAFVLIGFAVLQILFSCNGLLYGKSFHDVFKLQRKLLLQENEKVFHNVTDFDIDSNGNIWVIDCSLSNLFKFDGMKGTQTVMAREGRGPSEIVWPNGMFIDKNDRIIVACMQGRVTTFNTAGKEIDAFVGTARHLPTLEVLVNSEGSILIGGPKYRMNKKTNIRTADMIHLYTSNEKYIRSFCEKHEKLKRLNLNAYRSVIFDIDKEDNVYSVQPMDHMVSVFDKKGDFIRSFGHKNKHYKEPRLLPERINRDKEKLKRFIKTITYVLEVLVFDEMVFVVNRNFTDMPNIPFKYYIDVYDRKSGNVTHSGLETDLQLVREKNSNFYFLRTRLLPGGDEERIVEAYSLR